jgi:hypothetical protein
MAITSTPSTRRMTVSRKTRAWAEAALEIRTLQTRLRRLTKYLCWEAPHTEETLLCG